MANITISELRPAGADLFSDSESYLNDLNDNELDNVAGGWRQALADAVRAGSPAIATSGAFCLGVSVGVAASIAVVYLVTEE
jgi:hypothetical protein